MGAGPASGPPGPWESPGERRPVHLPDHPRADRPRPAGTLRIAVTLEVAGQPFAADITGQSVAELGLRPGLAVRAAVKATQVRVYGR